MHLGKTLGRAFRRFVSKVSEVTVAELFARYVVLPFLALLGSFVADATGLSTWLWTWLGTLFNSLRMLIPVG